MKYRFGECELDTGRRELRVKGGVQSLEPQVFDLLVFLVENGDRVVTRDELIEVIWQGRAVSDATLASRIRSVRRAIGDNGERQTFIQTVYGSGYRFLGSLRAAPERRVETSGAIEGANASPACLLAQLAVLRHGLQRMSGFGRQQSRWLAAFLIFAVVGIGLGGWRFIALIVSTRLPLEPSIAVLSFADMSEAGNQQYFADGVAEEILHALSQLPGLRVVGRTSSFAFKAKHVDVQTIRDRLHVSAVLEGSVRRFQNRVRITVQLVDAVSGYHVWSETYDRDMQDIFAIQGDIARTVAHRLQMGLQHAAPSRPLVAQETNDWEAYRLYLQGRYLWKRRDGDQIPHAIELFQEAITRDATFARAHSALAAAYAVLPTYTQTRPEDAFEAAERAAHAALQLKPELSEPHAVLGRLYSKRMQWRRAERQFRLAIAKDPADPVSHLWYGIHSISVGRLRQAMMHYERALSSDPAWGLAMCLHSEALYASGEQEAAMRGAERAVALGCLLGHIVLRDMAYTAGRLDHMIDHAVEHKRLRGASAATLRTLRRNYEAMLGVSGSRSDFLRQTERLLQSGRMSPRSAFYRFYHAQQVERAMALFDAKAEPRLLNFLRRLWGPYGQPFRTHPQFASIAADLNLIDYWREFGWPDHCRPDVALGMRCH